MGDEGNIDPIPKKKPRIGDLKRVAEIVMVLSAMGEMRGGKDPTAVEKALTAEARERLSMICEEEVKPKDLFSREAVRVVVEDLGLNRTRDPMMGFRPPKMSIAEKVLLTKRKMEESKEFASHSSPVYSSQLLPVGFGANSESHGTLLHGTTKFLPDRLSPVALCTGGFQSASPAVHAPALASATSSLKQSQVIEPLPAVTPIKSSTSTLERDSPSLTLPHAETAHLSLDAQFNGPIYLTQVRATSAAADYLPEKTPATSSVQSTAAAAVKLGQANNLLDHSQVKSEGAHVVNVQTSNQVMRNQETKTSEVQGAPANLLIGHQPSQDLTFVHGLSYFTTHNDIAKSVQKILQPKVFDHPNWTPPSTAYTNKPLNCQICKITITDVESLLVCDACEKGTHLKCLRCYVNKGIPKAEWHCPKCLIMSNGKPLPPKYGRVTRTIGPSKASSNIGATNAFSETREENLDSKVNQQKLVANGNSSLPHLAHASSAGNNDRDSTPDSKTVSAGEMQGFSSAAAGMKSEDKMYTVTSTNNSIERAGVVCVTPSMQSESSEKGIKNSVSSPCGMQRSTFESMLHPKIESENSCPEHSHDTVVETSDQSRAPSDSKVSKETEVPISVKASANQLHEISKRSTDKSKEPSELKGKSKYKAGCEIRLDGRDNSQVSPNGKPSTNESKVSSELKETSEYGPSCDIMLYDRDNSQATPNGALDNGDGSRDCAKPSLPEAHVVDWVGDSLQAIEEKTYYQSCRINGVLHKLQDHVLVSSKSHNFSPSQLQSLWEDNKTGSKWAIVNPYYFPSDLPEVLSQPSTPENNEVYASNNGSTIMASSICGPCEVLPMDKFREETDRTHLRDANGGLHPIFMCRQHYLTGVSRPGYFFLNAFYNRYRVK